MSAFSTQQTNNIFGANCGQPNASFSQVKNNPWSATFGEPVPAPAFGFSFQSVTQPKTTCFAFGEPSSQAKPKTEPTAFKAFSFESYSKPSSNFFAGAFNNFSFGPKTNHYKEQTTIDEASEESDELVRLYRKLHETNIKLKKHIDYNVSQDKKEFLETKNMFMKLVEQINELIEAYENRNTNYQEAINIRDARIKELEAKLSMISGLAAI